MSEKKYVPATPDSSVAKKWVNHLNSQVRKGGDIGVYSGNKNKEIIVPTSANEESNAQVNLARGFFSFYIDNDRGILYVYDSLDGWRLGDGYCGYSIVGNRSIRVPEAQITIPKIHGNIMCVYVHHFISTSDLSFKHLIYAEIRTSSEDRLQYACNFRIGRVKTTFFNGAYIYTPCYDVNVNPVVLG